MIRGISALLASPCSATVALIFALNSFMLANFFARVPTLQLELGLGHGELGLALTGLSAGSIAAMLGAGRLTARYGGASVSWWGCLALCVVGPLPTLAWDATSLGFALAALGLVNGTVAVAMNAEAAAAEDRLSRSMMASFHAMFSLGGIAGAVSGALAAAAGLAPRDHLLVVAVAATVATLARRGTLAPAAAPAAGAPPAPGPAMARPRGPLAGLALLCFATMLCEGAASDWSALHIARDLGSGPVLAALGYAGFAAGMTLGRLKGDALRDRFGEIEIVSAGSLLAAAGLALGLVLGHPVPAALGFACLGLGLSGVVPVILRTAASVPGVAPGVGIAAVASVGMVGFLAGPPLIGLLAERVGLAAALGTVPALAVAVALLSPEALGMAGAGRGAASFRPMGALARLAAAAARPWTIAPRATPTRSGWV